MEHLTVIVPTYNEAGNIPLLVPKLHQTLASENIPHDILVMDDNSPDGTAQECAKIKSKFPLECVLRTENRGLSPAVIEGFERAKGDIMLVMDADLSHPVEVVPLMYKAIVNGADVSVGSRHCAGGGIENWPLKRKILSWGAATLARPLTPCTDPMSGFFALRREVLDGAPLTAQGYKILLEVLVKGNYNKMVEVPITFKDREIGESKLTQGVIVNYISHLKSLYLFPGSAPFFKFLAVGGTGCIVDIVIFTMLLNLVALPAVFSQAGSFSVAVLWNFILNSLWTFPRSSSSSRLAQLFRFALVSLLSLGIRAFLFKQGQDHIGLTGTPGLQILLFGVILIVTIINFIGSKLWVFKTSAPGHSKRQ